MKGKQGFKNRESWFLREWRGGESLMSPERKSKELKLDKKKIVGYMRSGVGRS